jgi:VCBS repeat-containing protein
VKALIKKSSYIIIFFLGYNSVKSQTYTFTNAGTTGREGPTQAEINDSYLGTNLEGKVTINTRGIQEWLVPADGNYLLEAYGAQGESADSNYYGGKGAIIRGQFSLQKNTILQIAVGQEANSSNGFHSGGGGGGSFIYYDTGSELQFLTIAGGGGGTRHKVQQNGLGGRIEQYGGIGSANSTTSDGTVKNNHLRQGGIASSSSWGSGGGGVESDGEGDISYNDGGGKSLLNGLVGGHGNNTAADGGFGGGGSGQGSHGGGGGGGYSGGDGGRVAGGGGSYNSGTDQNNTAGANEGHGKVIITFLSLPTYTFTNAGATGREGPTQNDINASYLGTNLEGKVTINARGIQEWSVPDAGPYKIAVFGASGGSSSYGTGGKGASMSGKFVLEESQVLKIIAGQTGIGNIHGGGGGGGSFVVNGIDSTLLLAAGGGGGAGGHQETTINPHLQDGKDGVSVTSGTDAQLQGPGYGFTSLGQGGSFGSGGTGGVSFDPGAGGAGFLTDGTMGTNTSGYHPFEGKSFSNGFLGGEGRGKPNGGFGGGGSTALAGGGGGGYSGGGGGVFTGYSNADWGHGGGGGGSYNSGTDQNNTSGVNLGHGKIIITFLGSANEIPVISQGAGPISKVSWEDTQVSWSASELNATDSDTNAAQLSWSLLSSPSNGTAVVDGNGSSPQVFTYQPNANYHGSDSFSVQVSDGDANDSITINLTINPVDDPAVITGNTFGVLNEDSSVTGDLNATDIDGLTDGTYFSISSNATDGFATIDFEDGNWTYSPSANFYGSDSFSVIITDDDGNTSTQPINLTIHPVDDPSVITGNTSGVLNEDYILTGDLNATDIEGLTDGSYFSVSTPPTNGTSSIDATDGNWTYSPSTNFYGNDSFSVTITDDDGNTSTQLISLTVNPVDDPAVVTGDTSAVTNEDTTVTGDLNATDSDGLTDGSYFSISSSPSNGALSLNEESGRWTYYPNSNAYGNDSFTVTITDDQGFTSTQAVSITINPANDSTSVTGDLNATINEDYSASGDLNASDIDGLTDGSYFSVSSNPSNGTASIDAVDGNWTYIPTPNLFGADSFTITITDDQGYTATQEISVIINSVDDATLISGDTNATINEDSSASGDLNASDIDGLIDGSYFTVSTSASNGIASIDLIDGNWTYIPSSNFFGTDSFTVTITDDLNYTITQAISVTINAVDDPTLITGDTSGLLFLNHSATGDLNASDMDGLTDASYFTVQTTPSFGTATVDPITW